MPYEGNTIEPPTRNYSRWRTDRERERESSAVEIASQRWGWASSGKEAGARSALVVALHGGALAQSVTAGRCDAAVALDYDQSMSPMARRLGLHIADRGGLLQLTGDGVSECDASQLLSTNDDLCDSTDVITKPSLVGTLPWRTKTLWQRN
ncbi:conserved hypothetical protein [Coccidioides posadasii str. Silveira]|uniref:Uncharacterized protein n=1 Tax=Coccidioides posadasii (strain RMSCC 757 / Silveira) TaxID=443226 RepID=E9DK08_COCPS|nr:conserved hypothetical protein [Coccidioides posadasii str. Silveira]